MDDDARGARRAALRGAALAADPRLPRPAADRLRGARAVGVHEPRDGLRAAARGRARAHLRLRVGRERGADGRRSRSRSSCSPTRARAGCCSATSAPRRSSCSACGGCCAGASRCACGATTCARCCASGCRRCRPTRASTRCRWSTASTCSAPTRTPPPGTYAVAIKLATVVFVAVRGFQYAWPPLAYSIESDDEAARLYSLVTTYYALATGVVVCAVALLGRWLVRLLAAPAVLRRAPRAAVAGARLGAVRPVPRVRRDRRPRARDLAQPARRGRAGWPSTSRCCSCSSPTSGAGLGIAGRRPRAVRRLRWRCCAVIYLLTRSLFAVGFEWRRLAQLDGDPRRRRRLRRAAAARPRRRRPARPRRLARARAGGAAADAASSTRTSGPRRGALAADGRRRVAAFRAAPRRGRGLRRGPAARHLGALAVVARRPPRAAPRRAPGAASRVTCRQ